MAGSNVAMQLDGGHVTTPTVFVDLEVTRVDALIQCCATHTQDARGFGDLETKLGKRFCG